MAKPIEPTPTLSGEDAEEFIRQMRIEERTVNPQKAKFLQKCYLTYLKYRN
jgi:hypothetical protein